MSRPRFLADHDVNDSIVRGVLRSEPLLELHRARDLSLSRAPDSDILAFADENNLIVVSHDMNTMIAAANQRIRQRLRMRGLCMITQEADIGRAVDDLLLVWAAGESEEWENRILYIPFG